MSRVLRILARRRDGEPIPCIRCGEPHENGGSAICARCEVDERLKLLRIEESAREACVRVRYCAWCGEIIERVPAMGSDIGQITHGYHPACASEHMEAEGI